MIRIVNSVLPGIDELNVKCKKVRRLLDRMLGKQYTFIMVLHGPSYVLPGKILSNLIDSQ